MRHVPGGVAASGPGLENLMMKSLEAAAAEDPSSPEAEFLVHWGADDSTWRDAAAGRISTFMAAVAERLADDAGLDDLMRLAESRRREFRRRPLSEFGLTLPRLATVAPDAPLLLLKADGRVTGSISNSEGNPAMAFNFDPPGHLEDLDAAGRQRWHGIISRIFDRAREGSPQDNDGPRLQFFNPASTAAGADAVEEDIEWSAFPRQVEIDSGSDEERWSVADGSRDVQDEYCEWSVERQDGNIVRVFFTCEGPEYWELLAESNFDLVVDLYRRHVNPGVMPDDLRDGAGNYRPRNKWNNSTTRGAMHLVQRANTLGAEIQLAAGASIVRARPDGTVLTGTRELIDCSGYGERERHSDPTIGAKVNAHARARSDVTLANPVGLYFARVDFAAWETPDGSDPAGLWRFTRGKNGKFVRAVVEAPAGAGFTLSQVNINNRPLRFGAQIVDTITMKLTAVATRIGQSMVQPTVGCRGQIGAGAGMGAPLSSEERLVERWLRGTR